VRVQSHPFKTATPQRTRKTARERTTMANHPRFGPAGVPPFFRTLGAEVADVPLLLHEEGLDAFEYQAVRWGPKPQMKQESAEQLGIEAKKNDVLLSLHGSYFVNLAGSKEVVEASKRRLVACATAARWMGANVVVFHLGYYGAGGRARAFRDCAEALKDVVATMTQLGIRDTKLGPETMGKPVQVGSLDEILTLCETVERIQLVIDWGHLHARSGGRLSSVEDFRAVVEEAEKRLGTEAVRDMHCHFSKIEFTKHGERRHHILDEKRFGPEFEPFATVISDFKLCPVVICETPLLDVDAVKMRDEYNSMASSARR
jgi:deoxyribonuclease-4